MRELLKKPFLEIIHFLGKIKVRKRFSQPPVLLGGSARSGTTILLSILSSHEEIFACPHELRLFEKMFRDEKGKLISGRMYRLYRTVLFHRIKKTANRWCEKSPVNVLRIPEIDEYFQGNFRFIHIIRDGRDAVLSIHPSNKKRYWNNPDRWVRDVSAGLKYREDPRILTIHYEDLVNKFEEIISGICKFLDIPVSESILNWYEHTTVRKNRAYHSGVKQLHRSSVGKWQKKKYAERLGQFMDNPEAVDLLKELGYLEKVNSMD